MHKKCLICNKDFKPLILNDLKMRQCKSCGLIWREDFDVLVDYYQKKEVDLSGEKIKARILNSEDRIKTFKRYADLNNLCDIGCGEGIFLKTLKGKGYKNIIGIEPNLYFLNYAKKNHLKVFKGRIKDFPEIIRDKNIHTVSMFHLIEHLENPLSNLKLIYNNLQKGDKLIIETPDINGYSFKKMNYKHRLIYPEHFFYFNKANLCKLLEKIGFKIIANGRRDFTHYHLSIKESLFRLGLLPASGSFSDNDSKRLEGSEFKKTKSSYIELFVKNIIRKTLSRIVVMLGRLDFIWVVAEK